jgi:hypothetical protein
VRGCRKRNLRNGHNKETTICKVAALLTRFQKDPVRRNGRLKSDRKGLKMRGPMSRSSMLVRVGGASRGCYLRRMVFFRSGIRVAVASVRGLW